MHSIPSLQPRELLISMQKTVSCEKARKLRLNLPGSPKDRFTNDTLSTLFALKHYPDKISMRLRKLGLKCRRYYAQLECIEGSQEILVTTRANSGRRVLGRQLEVTVEEHQSRASILLQEASTKQCKGFSKNWKECRIMTRHDET